MRGVMLKRQAVSRRFALLLLGLAASTLAALSRLCCSSPARLAFVAMRPSSAATRPSSVELGRQLNVVMSAGSSLAPADVTPLGGQVLVEELDPPEETKGGLLLAGSAKNKRPNMRIGRVLAKGQGRLGDLRDPQLLQALQEGDTVLWEDYANRPLNEQPDNKFYLIPARSIKAKVVSK